MAVRLTSESSEAIISGAPTAMVTSASAEAIISGSAAVRLTSVSVEVIVPSSSGGAGGQTPSLMLMGVGV